MTHSVAPIGSTDELRDFAADCLRRASLYAQHGAELAEARDDLGVETNTRKLIASVRAGIEATQSQSDPRGFDCLADLRWFH
jgi:hypothetical protein